MTAVEPLHSPNFNAVGKDPLRLASRLLEAHSDSRPPWPRLARPEQQEPDGDWSTWLILAGRGFGKTFAGAGWLAHQAMNRRGDYAAIAPTFRDLRDVCVEGPSGLLTMLGTCDWNRSLGELRLPNGSRIFAVSAEEPDRLRGRNLSGAWCDELAAFPNPERLWAEALMPALRIGERPRVVVTTTPRAGKLLKDLTTRDDGTVTVTRGSTFDNATNLSRAALSELVTRYGGTRMGRQELDGELLEDMEGALWTASLLDATRVHTVPSDLVRVVVGVDPAVTSGERADETGIVVAARGADGHVYVLADYSGKYSPDGWAQRVGYAYERHQADAVVVETNQGGDLVVRVLRSGRSQLPVKPVHASRGKRTRAEPISALWEQGRAHVVGSLPDLEEQLVSWAPGVGASPDRLDAMVWAATDLATFSRAQEWLEQFADMCTCGYPNRRGSRNCQRCGTALPSGE